MNMAKKKENYMDMRYKQVNKRYRKGSINSAEFSTFNNTLVDIAEDEGKSQGKMAKDFLAENPYILQRDFIECNCKEKYNTKVLKDACVCAGNYQLGKPESEVPECSELSEQRKKEYANLQKARKKIVWK